MDLGLEQDQVDLRRVLEARHDAHDLGDGVAVLRLPGARRGHRTRLVDHEHDAVGVDGQAVEPRDGLRLLGVRFGGRALHRELERVSHAAPPARPEVVVREELLAGQRLQRVVDRTADAGHFLVVQPADERLDRIANANAAQRLHRRVAHLPLLVPEVVQDAGDQADCPRARRGADREHAFPRSATT